MMSKPPESKAPLFSFYFPGENGEGIYIDAPTVAEAETIYKKSLSL